MSSTGATIPPERVRPATLGECDAEGLDDAHGLSPAARAWPEPCATGGRSTPCGR